MEGMLRTRTMMSFTLGALLSTSTWAKPKFDTTSSGIQESDTYGGISESEMKGLDDQARKILEKFKDGREEGGASTRFDDLLVNHDKHKRGLADHGLNGLEKTLDKAANDSGAKIKTVMDGDKREEEIQKARGNAGDCKNGKGKGLDEGDCRNISANIVDRGSAHGKDDDGHRVYDLSDESFKSVKKVGDAYAQRTINDAANYDINDPAAKEMGVTAQGVDAKGKYIMVKGQRVGVAANTALLQSETSFLNQQAATIVESERVYLRAQRLAGFDTSRGNIDPELRDLISKSNKKDPKKAEQEIATYIAKNNALGGQEISCRDNQAKCNEWKSTYCGSKSGPERTSCESQFASDAKIKPEAIKGNIEVRKAMLEVAEKSASAETKKNMQKNIANAQECMKPGMWCGNDLDPKAKGVRDASKATDTREIMADTALLMVNMTPEQAMRALKGINMDVNEANDKKAKNIKLYQGWVERIKRAQEIRQAVIAEAKSKGEPSPFSARSTMSEILTSRDLNRAGEGDTLGRGRVAGTNSGAAGPANSSQPTRVPGPGGGGRPNAGPAMPINRALASKPRKAAPRPDLNNPFFREAVKP